MKEKLTQYVDLLFTGTADTDDIRQEILQNTLDRYDDLIAQGKSPEAAYRLAIGGIGDINEIIGNASTASDTSTVTNWDNWKPQSSNSGIPVWKKVLRALAVCLYIISPIPLFILSEFGMEILGLCGTLAIVATATALLIFAGGKSDKTEDARQPETELQKAISTAVGILCLLAYLGISFATGAWWITWLIFPIAGAIKGIIRACTDLKTAKGSAIARIVIYIIISLLLVSILCACLGLGKLTFDLGLSDGTAVVGEVSINASDVNNLEIDWAAGSVRIAVADTEKITFSDTGSENAPMTYALDGDTLRLAYSKGQVQIGFVSTPSKDLTVTVPRDWDCEELEINAASVDVNITDVTVTDLSLNGASNDLGFFGSIDHLDCDGASNELLLVCANKPDEINVNGASCSLNLELPYDCGFRAKLNGLSCDFDSDLGYTTSDGVHSYGDEFCKIDVDGVACDVSVSAPAKSALYVIKTADKGTDELLLEPLVGSYVAGSTVTIKSSFADWAKLELWVDGEYVCDETSVQDGDFVYAEFSFTMPNHDAVIQLKWTDDNTIQE